MTSKIRDPIILLHPVSNPTSYSKLLLMHSILIISKDTHERWGAGVETQKNVRGEIEGWGRVPFNEPYTSSLINIYDGA